MTSGRSISSRRRVVQRAGLGATAIWATPAITTWDALAAATGSPVESTTGQVTIATLSSGDSLRPNSNQYSSNSTGFVFAENCTQLTSSRTTDSGDALPIGVEIQAYLFHFSRQGGSGTISGTFTVPGTIIGWDWTDDGLVAGDNPFAVAGVNYGTTRRRAEPPGDSFTVNTTTGVVSINSFFVDRRFNDQIRVFVLP